MELRDPFMARDDQIAIDLSGAHALFTTRSWGDVRDTQEQIADRLGLRLVRPKQVHGNHVTTVSGEASPAPGEADAIVTAARGVAAAVIAADCLPIVVASPNAVAAVHAG